MTILDFLSNIKTNNDEVVHFCANHILKKLYTNFNDTVKEEELKTLFLNYSLYDKYLNDVGQTIYNNYESSIDEVYKILCNTFNESFDNIHLYEYRLKRVLNQDPKKYLQFDDEDIRDNAISRLEKRINEIETSKYYKENMKNLEKDLEKILKDIELVKKAIR